MTQVDDRLSQYQKFRPEVVAPLADAVGFIHDKQVDRLLLQKRAELRLCHPLGSGVDKFHSAGGDGGVQLALLIVTKRAVERRYADAALSQTIGLIFHERNQRRDDD